jgi:hypothetical protein
MHKEDKKCTFRPNIKPKPADLDTQKCKTPNILYSPFKNTWKNEGSNSKTRRNYDIDKRSTCEPFHLKEF